MQGNVAPEAKADTAIYVGLDVCKAFIDVYLHPLGRAFRVPNTSEGLRSLARSLRDLKVALVVVEATGKLHRLAHRHLHAAGYPVAVVNPYRSKAFASALGQLAKTDRIDARMLALFAESLQPAATPPTPALVAELQELVLARQSAVAEQTALDNRLAAAESRFVKAELGRLRKAVARAIARLEAEIARLIASDPLVARRYEILVSIPGIGPIVAATLAACLAELGALPAKKITMLVGLAPVNDDSGDRRGQKHIKGGRDYVRSPLYFAAMAATRCNPDIRIFYRRLRDELRKSFKVACVAAARKLLVLANTLIAENRLWQPKSA